MLRELDAKGWHAYAPDWPGFGFSEHPQPRFGFNYTEAEFHTVRRRSGMFNGMIKVQQDFASTPASTRSPSSASTTRKPNFVGAVLHSYHNNHVVSNNMSCIRRSARSPSSASASSSSSAAAIHRQPRRPLHVQKCISLRSLSLLSRTGVGQHAGRQGGRVAAQHRRAWLHHRAVRRHLGARQPRQSGKARAHRRAAVCRGAQNTGFLSYHTAAALL